MKGVSILIYHFSWPLHRPCYPRVRMELWGEVVEPHHVVIARAQETSPIRRPAVEHDAIAGVYNHLDYHGLAQGRQNKIASGQAQQYNICLLGGALLKAAKTA